MCWLIIARTTGWVVVGLCVSHPQPGGRLPPEAVAPADEPLDQGVFLVHEALATARGSIVIPRKKKKKEKMAVPCPTKLIMIMSRLPSMTGGLHSRWRALEVQYQWHPGAGDDVVLPGKRQIPGVDLLAT